MSTTKTVFRFIPVLVTLLALTGCFGFRSGQSSTQGGDEEDDAFQSGDSSLDDLFNWQPSGSTGGSEDGEDDTPAPTTPPTSAPVSLTCNWVAQETYPIQVVGTCQVPASCSSELQVAFPDGNAASASGLGIFLMGYPVATDFYQVDTTNKKFRFSSVFCGYPNQNIEIRFLYQE